MLLTDFGQLMRPHLEQVLGQAETARSVAQNFHLLNRAPLGVGVLATIGPLRLSRFLARFQRDHAGVEVSVSEGLLDDLTARLDKGDLELAVLSAPEGLDERFRTTSLYKERYVVVFPPDHDMKDRDAIRLSDLAGEPYVDRLACEMRDLVMAACGERKVELYATFRSEREDWVQGMVLAGMGFAFMPEYSVTLPGMLSRPLTDPVVERNVMMVSMAGRQYSPAAAAFVRAAQIQDWPG
jgi:DNA-binding transcriptional LysR family regulator